MVSVLVPLATGCEEIEAVTVVDLLRRAGIKVVTAGLTPGPVHASRGVVLVPDALLDDVLGQPFDMVVLPGGMPGSAHLRDDPRVMALLRSMSVDGRWMAAICAAPMALLAAGVLAGKRATSFPGVLDQLPGTHEVSAEPVVVDGRVVTSRGPGTAMDFALTLVELLAGKAKRDQVEAGLVR
ncbi:protein deglycase [uncultured bacterium]|nr:protein deglycase [uncultured bacterium]